MAPHRPHCPCADQLCLHSRAHVITFPSHDLSQACQSAHLNEVCEEAVDVGLVCSGGFGCSTVEVVKLVKLNLQQNSIQDSTEGALVDHPSDCSMIWQFVDMDHDSGCRC